MPSRYPGRAGGGVGSAYALLVRRVVVIGNSGSGKTTLAAEVAERLGVPHVELDAHFHQAGWTPTPTEQFAVTVRAALDAAAAGGPMPGPGRPSMGCGIKWLPGNEPEAVSNA